VADCPGCPRRSGGRRWVAPRREVPLSGILNVDKPAGITSHDVVDVIRRVSGQRRVGHAGTLDPMATGVLLVCLGQATRVAEYLMLGRKRYRATIVLGSTTDTYDAEGDVMTSGGRTDFEQAGVEAALAGFLGRSEQLPPVYSALKQGGEPLHRRVRRGETVEVQPRAVEIDELRLLDWQPPALIVDITCSPGTYIRSLAHDLGRRLGSGAYLAALVRLASGRFSLEDATSLERLEEAFEHGQEEQFLLPPDEALLDWPAIIVAGEDQERLVQGRSIPAGAAAGGPALAAAGQGEAGWARAYSSDGDFLAIVAYEQGAGRWRPKKVFHAGN
jgi:tRNA pseudouridine55 synthase